ALRPASSKHLYPCLLPRARPESVKELRLLDRHTSLPAKPLPAVNIFYRSTPRNGVRCWRGRENSLRRVDVIHQILFQSVRLSREYCCYSVLPLRQASSSRSF